MTLNMNLCAFLFSSHIHSVSREMHHDFIGFRCDPGSRSNDPKMVIFDHETGVSLHIGNESIGKMKYTDCYF